MTEVTGIDHIYITVSDLGRSEPFYDHVLFKTLGFRKNSFVLGGDPHVQYFNRHFGYVLRPSRNSQRYDSYAAGLHHFCFRVESVADVVAVSNQLRALGVEASEAKLYPETVMTIGRQRANPLLLRPSDYLCFLAVWCGCIAIPA